MVYYTEQVAEEYLSGKVGGTTLGHLQDDGAVLVAGSFERSDDGGGGGHVLFSQLSPMKSGVCRTYNGGNGKLLLLSILEELEDVIADDDTSLAGQLLEDTHVVCI